MDLAAASARPTGITSRSSSRRGCRHRPIV